MLLDVLRDGAGDDPARAAVVAVTGTLTYGDAVDRAQDVARGLRARGIERFGIAVADPIEIVVLLAGAAGCGAEACVYPRDLDDEGVARFAAMLDHGTVVVDGPRDLGGREAVPVSDLPRADGDLDPPSATPVVILTTGTSGTPKGVRHDWARLVDAARRGGGDADARWLLAYNLNQFAGYQVLLHALVRAATVVVPRTSQARDAIEAMRGAGVTHASATPTFWRLLVGERDAGPADPIPLQQITLGGEATPADLLERLRAHFPDARLTHVYAGTEFGSAVAVTDGMSGLPASVLDRDETADVQFRVVDGELHVRSRHAMRGYLGGEETGDGWIASGDLVEERDGRLHFVGRTVEIINVGGAKVHPLPIEGLVVGVPGVVLAAVYGAPNAITGQIVAVDVVRAPSADEAEVKAGIHAACSVLPPPGRPRRVRFVDELETRGNKVIRREGEVRT